MDTAIDDFLQCFSGMCHSVASWKHQCIYWKMQYVLPLRSLSVHKVCVCVRECMRVYVCVCMHLCMLCECMQACSYYGCVQMQTCADETVILPIKLIKTNTTLINNTLIR